MSQLTEIIYRMLAWTRPLLWYCGRLGYFLSVAIRYLKDDACCLRLLESPALRTRVEGMLVDAERCLDIAIGLRVRELLGLPIELGGRMGIGGFHRQHSPTSLEHLAARLDRLVQRYNDLERLAQLRASRLRREAETLLPAWHPPQHSEPAGFVSIESVSADSFTVARCNPASITTSHPSHAAVPIRGPPDATRLPQNLLAAPRSPHLRDRLRMPDARKSQTLSPPTPLPTRLVCDPSTP